MNANDPRQRYLAEMKSKLSLTDAQVAQFDAILDDTKAKYKAVRDSYRPAMLKIKADHIDRIKSILNAQQFGIYQNIVAEREQKTREQEERERQEEQKRAAARGSNTFPINVTASLQVGRWLWCRIRAGLTHRFLLVSSALFALSASLPAQSRLTPGTQPFIALNDPVIALAHVRVIDGTGARARPDQTIVVDHGRIAASRRCRFHSHPQRSADSRSERHTVYPGLVGMHEHLFYPSGGGIPMYNEQAFSATRLYLASGITTMRTGGSLEPYTDINIKKLIDSGAMPGPAMDATGPYIQGPGGFSIQMPSITSPAQARRLVDYWAQEGSTSFKAYMNISHDALGEAIKAAHEHGLKITGHLCSVGFTEAAELGIDDLEHGLGGRHGIYSRKATGCLPGWASGRSLHPEPGSEKRFRADHDSHPGEP